MRYRGRFAPSPTGPLHFGSLLAALASYCDARHAGGEWWLRIEDVDGERSLPAAADNIIATLMRYGFRWDHEAPRQSTRSRRYQDVLDTLIAHGDAYPCTCSRQRLHDAPIGISGERVYPGYCRPTTLSLHNAMPPSAAAAWRLRIEDTLPAITFTDHLQGTQTQLLQQECGDFILKRRDGFYAYHLAVVVDDIEQGITHIVRGADLLTLTPRHQLLYMLLGASPPSHLHIPVATTADGQKLSKQTQAPSLPESPLPTLLAAWRFLGQPLPSHMPGDVSAFWTWALPRWNTAAIPAATQCPAPTSW